MKEISITNPEAIRALKDHPGLVSEELYKAEPNGHAFKPGDKCTLVGLVDFPEYNGEEVEISAIRKDGSRGRAYYIKGRINEVLNWTYEYRLEAK